MEMRVFGRTGMQLSVLGFGCGAVGGLMVRGDALDQERTVARAIAIGVNYFDTAVQYGNGESEKNLGRVLHNLKASDVVVGTKVRLPSAEFGCIADAVATSLEGSLARLRREHVDIFHLHNAITEAGGEEALSVPKGIRHFPRWRGCSTWTRAPSRAWRPAWRPKMEIICVGAPGQIRPGIPRGCCGDVAGRQLA